MLGFKCLMGVRRRFEWSAVWLVLILSVSLVGGVVSPVSGVAYTVNVISVSSLTAESPKVILQSGNAGENVIYKNDTSGLVEVEASTSTPTYNPNGYNLVTGSHVSGSVPDSVESLDYSYFIVRSYGTETATATYNPSAYNLLGGTSLISGSISNLASNDGIYMVFESYYTGTQIQDYVDLNLNENFGSHSNFTALQYGPDGGYDVLTEENTYIFSMEWGTVTVNDTFTTVNLVNTYQSPIIVCAPAYTSGIPRTVRIKDVTSTSFKVRVQNPSGETCPATTVHYIVVEEGVWSLPNGMRLEAKKYSTNTVGENNNWAYDTRSYSQTYSGNIVVLHQVMTYNDPTWITTYVSKLNSRIDPPSSADTGFRIALNGAEAVNSHGTETIGYIVIEEGYGTLNGTKYEVKRTADAIQGFDNSPPYYTAFSQTFTSTPEVVVSSQEEMDGGNGGWIVDHTVNQTHCGLMVDEDQVQDAERSHISETAGFWVFESAGSYRESYIRAMEWGTVVCTNEDYQTVNLVNTYQNPIVVCSPQYNSGVPTGVIVKNVTSRSFQVKLDRPSGTFSGSRVVHYIVCEAGSFTLPDGRRVIAGSISTTKYGYSGSNWDDYVTVNFEPAFENPPVVLHTRVSEESSDWYVTFTRSTSSRTEPPTTNSMGIAFNRGQLGTGMVNDTLHYIAIEPGYGTLNGIKYDVKRTADAIRGFADSPPYTTAFSQTFTSTPEVCVVAQLEMDGPNGGWGILYSITSTSFGMAIDETLETDRRHTTETCGAVAFETSGSWSTANYQLNLEVSWNNVDYNEENEELCIYAGAMGGEDLRVDYWNGSAWINVFTDLTPNSWNNASIQLTGTTLTLRFIGGTESGDGAQDSWEIDALLLHVWTDEYTVEVELSGTSNTYNWEKLVWTVDSSWTVEGVNVTLQLYDWKAGQYPSSGDGYIYYTSGVANSDETYTQQITTNSEDFRNSTGGWKVKIRGVKRTSVQFDLKLDLVEYETTYYSEYRVSTEFLFTGMTSDSPTWLNFTIVSEYTISGVNVTIQVWNYTSSSYAESGEGYINYISTGANETRRLNITTNPSSCVSDGNAKIKITGILSTTTQYDQKVDEVKLEYGCNFLGELTSLYNPESYNIQVGSYQSGSVPNSLQEVDADYFIVNSVGSGTVTSSYNPSDYTLLGGTTLVSGTVNDLTGNDGAYMVFRSYYSGTNIEDYVDLTVGSGVGTHSNFTAQQYGPDGGYDTLTEESVGSGLNFFHSSPWYYDVTPSVTGSWQDVDVSAYIPEGSTGVILEIVNTGDSNRRASVRKNGETYDIVENNIRLHGHIYAICAVDENRVFEAYVASSSIRLYLVGYTDSAVVLFDDPTEHDYSLTTTGSWVDIDLSADVPPDATGVIIWEVNTGLYGNIGAVRCKGSTDDYSDNGQFITRGHRYSLIAVDSNRHIQGYISNTAVDFYLVGYVKDPVHLFVNGKDVSLSTAGSWQLIDATDETSSKADGLIIQVVNRGTAFYQSQVREYGSTQDWHTNTDLRENSYMFYYVGCDSEQRFEGWIENTQQDFYIIGYCEPRYKLNLEEEWTSLNYELENEELCIYAGAMGGEDLRVDYWNGSAWINVFTDLTPNSWNNATVNVSSSTFKIRFRGGLELDDPNQDSWEIDAVLLHLHTDEHTVEVELSGTSNTYNWEKLVWSIDSSWTTSGVSVTIQLYNWTAGQYPPAGDGCISYTSGAANSDETYTQQITTNPEDFRNSTGGWKVKIRGVKSTAVSFDLKVDQVEYTPSHYNEYTACTEFIFNVATSTPTMLNFTVVSEYSVSGVNVTIQVWNYSSSSYVESGEGYINYISTGTNETETLNITLNPHFYAHCGGVKIRITGTLDTLTPYEQRVNLIRLDYTHRPAVYDYTLKIVNKVSDEWKIRLRAYNETGISRLTNCTIVLYDGESSTQISIIDGAYTKQVGDWYNLTSYGVVYLSITVRASSASSNSMLWLYLEILIPNSTVLTRFILIIRIT